MGSTWLDTCSPLQESWWNHTALVTHSTTVLGKIKMWVQEVELQRQDTAKIFICIQWVFHQVSVMVCAYITQKIGWHWLEDFHIFLFPFSVELSPYPRSNKNAFLYLCLTYPSRFIIHVLECWLYFAHNRQQYFHKTKLRVKMWQQNITWLNLWRMVKIFPPRFQRLS